MSNTSPVYVLNKRGFFVGILFLVFFAITLNFHLSTWLAPGYILYDINRIAKVGLLVLCDCFRQLPNFAKIAMGLIVSLGLVSVLLAQMPQHALLEYSLFLALGFLSVYLMAIRQRYHQSADTVLLICILLSIAIYTVTFITVYIQILFDPITSLTLFNDNFFPGFVNIRFFAQYQIWTMPFIVIPILYFFHRSKLLSGLFFILASFWLS